MTPTLRPQNSPRTWTSNHECEAQMCKHTAEDPYRHEQEPRYSVLHQITTGPSMDQSFQDQIGKLLNDCDKQCFFGLKKLKTIVILLFF